MQLSAVQEQPLEVVLVFVFHRLITMQTMTPDQFEDFLNNTFIAEPAPVEMEVEVTEQSQPQSNGFTEVVVKVAIGATVVGLVAAWKSPHGQKLRTKVANAIRP
jgi:hypothetical protein